MSDVVPDHYATLGLDRDCPDEHIRAAYRALAKRYHPDVNPGAPGAMARIQKLNAAYAQLGDTTRRRSYDRELEQVDKIRAAGLSVANIAHTLQLNLQDFLRGRTCEFSVRDTVNREQVETYRLVILPDTAPGARFRLKRATSFGRGWVVVRLKARPDFRFKPRGSDLRCDLKISGRRAVLGGMESIRSVTGHVLRVPVPPQVVRGHLVRIAGEGLPKARGGRGDLLVRITFRPEVRVAQGR